MAVNFSTRLEEWKDQTQNLVEQNGIRLLCLYIDQKSGKVNLLADSESKKRLGQSRAALKDLESILESKVDEKVNLCLYDHNQVLESEEPCSKSGHSCHHPAPMFQLGWEKNPSTDCFAGKKWFPDVKDYDKLPAEILRILFGFLKPEDLKNMLLVSKKWKSVADEPVLWAGFDLPQKCRENSENFYRFLDTFSLSSKLQHLTLTGSESPPDENLDVNVDYFKFEVKDEHIQHLLNVGLASIEIKSIDLSKVSDDLLAKLVNSCQHCDITEYYEDYPPPPNNNFLDLSSDDDDVKQLFLGVKKITAILRESQEGSKLKSLRLRYLQKENLEESVKLDLSSIPSDILARAFSKIEVLDLENLQFTSEQLSSIFDDGLGRGLRRVRLHGVEMDFIQARHFMKVLGTSCQLNKLDLSGVDVRDIPSMFLGSVINKIEWVVLKDLKITTDQLDDIFVSIIRGNSALKHLGMFGMNSSLSEVDLVDFSTAVNLLESVAFDEKLPKDLIEVMFGIMAIQTNLKIIGMPGEQIPVDAFEHIEEVHEKVLADALNNLTSVRIDMGNYDRDCFFNMPQLITFFKQLSSRSQLKRIVREDYPDWTRFPY